MTALDRDPSAAPASDRLVDPIARLTDVAITHEGADAALPAGVSFEIRPGEVVLLLGPSGSGKSTLALAFDGLIPHAVPADLAGMVEIAGRDAAEASVAELSTHVAMVFQDPDAQLVTGTLLDEVAFGPENLKLPVDVLLARAEDALSRVGLWDRRAENPDRLSGGGRQRLAIACALAMGSPLLVLDEPTANLDPQGIEEVYASLAELVAAGDRAVLLIEHNLDAAIDLVDRVVVLDAAGRVAADGPVGTVLRDRADELVAMGVWLPVATLAALRLHRAGYALDPLPLTPAELRTALEVTPAPATPVAERAHRDEALHPETDPPRFISSLRSSLTDRQPDPLIRVHDLTVRRGRAEILHGVSLDIAAGEFVAIVGANGAGKTTLLQAIAGVVAPPRGTVRIGDLDIGRVDARRRAERIGFVFQNPEHQFVAHTVHDEIAHGLRGVPDAEARTTALLERFGLAHKADAHPFLLSGGQKRRLSVGTALVAGAPVLALDEPTFGQDRSRADELLGLLAELNAAGTTILVVTHDMQLVTEYAHHTVVVSDGRIAASGPTADVFADRALIESAGLRLPPLQRALAGLSGHPELAGIARVSDLPGGEA